MLAAVLEGVNKMVLKDVAKPKPCYGEVIVQMKACGICQTDYSAYTGRRMNWTPGIIVGHEMAGVIDEIGEGVKRFKKGDAVVISPAVSCGACEYCKRGLQHYCPDGLVIGGDARATSRSESAADLLCVELETDGLPIDDDHRAVGLAGEYELGDGSDGHRVGEAGDHGECQQDRDCRPELGSDEASHHRRS